MEQKKNVQIRCDVIVWSARTDIVRISCRIVDGNRSFGMVVRYFIPHLIEVIRLGLIDEETGGTMPCASAFVTNRIDGQSLLMIGDDDLTQMGVTNFAHRRLIVQSISLLVDLVCAFS